MLWKATERKMTQILSVTFIKDGTNLFIKKKENVSTRLFFHFCWVTENPFTLCSTTSTHHNNQIMFDFFYVFSYLIIMVKCEKSTIVNRYNSSISGTERSYNSEEKKITIFRLNLVQICGLFKKQKKLLSRYDT